MSWIWLQCCMMCQGCAVGHKTGDQSLWMHTSITQLVVCAYVRVCSVSCSWFILCLCQPHTSTLSSVQHHCLDLGALFKCFILVMVWVETWLCSSYFLLSYLVQYIDRTELFYFHTLICVGSHENFRIAISSMKKITF